jgi:DNA-binding CsgD family transcriptional regulator
MQYWQALVREISHGHLGHSSDMDEWIEQEERSVRSLGPRDLRQYYLGDQYPNTYFTKREAECAFWLVNHLTIVETAYQMSLSPRTVEYYVKHMKEKLQCGSKKVLLQKILETDLMALLAAEGMARVVH